MSFQLSVSPHRRAAARFVSNVHRRLLQAYAQNPAVTQTEIAHALGVHRSVINRQLRGKADMSLGRVAELAWVMGLEPEFDLTTALAPVGSNTPDDPMGGANAEPPQGRVETKDGAAKINFGKVIVFEDVA